MSINSVKNDTIAKDSVVSAQKPIPPTISGYTLSGIDDTALDPAGGQTVLINGTGFQRGATITFDGSAVSVVSWVSSNQLSFTTPAKSAGTYAIYVVNTDGGTAIYLPGVIYSALPTWTTSSGSLGSYYETQAISNTVVASGDAPLTYSLYSGSLPSGATLSSGGVITGTSPAESGSTTYTFTVKATDAQLQDSTRSFSLTINTDVISWSSPANASVVSSYEYSNISNVTLSASSIVGGTSITYTGNSFPTGITLSGNTISGMSNTVANTATLLTATGNATGRTATRTVYFNVQQDSVTWSSPADGTTYSITGGAISNVTLAATSAAGQNVSFAANALPTGVSLSGNTISGTPTVQGNTTTLLTATAATTNRSATRTIYWVVRLGDSYWKYTSLLLNGSTPTTTFINDASLNNSQLTIAGDTKPNNFNPYSNGYYSNYFDGTGDYLSIAGSSQFVCTGDFTISCWVYPSGTLPSYSEIAGQYYSTGTAEEWLMEINSNGSMLIYLNGAGSTRISTAAGIIVANKWQYVSLVRSGTTVTLYVDGVSKGTTTKSDTFGSSTKALTIGAYYSPAAGFFTGYISNFRILKGTADTTVPTAPLTAITNTSLLTCQSNRIIDNSLNQFTVTKNGDTTVSSAHPFATPTNVAYNTRYSTYFDGTGDYLSAPSNAAFDFGTGNFTIECWAYATNLSNSPALITKAAAQGAGVGWFIELATNIVYFGYGTAGSNFATFSVTLGTNAWYHIACTRTGGTLNCFVNGVSAGAATGFSTSSYDNSNPLLIGYGFGNASYAFTGYISNVRVVKGTVLYSSNFTPSTTPLTAVANTSLLTCQNSTLIDNSTNAFTITSAGGDARPVAVSPFTMTTSNTTVTSLGSAYFDGSGDYLTTSTNAAFTYGTGDFTIEMWVYITANPADYTYIYAQGPNSTASMCIYIQSGYFKVWNGSSIITASSAYSLNTWYHVALSRSGTSLKLFVNGVQVGSSTNSSSITTGSTYGANIGSWVEIADGRYLTGYIADCRVIKGTALYTSNFLPPQTPLTAVTNTQLLTLQYNGGANNNGFVDQSSFNNLVTRAGNATQGTFSPYSQNGWSISASGDGAELYITTTNGYVPPTTSSFTYECWVYPTAFANYKSICRSHTSGTAEFEFFCNSSGQLTVLNSAGSAVATTTTALTLGVWSHVALVRNGTALTIYIGGVSSATATFSANINSTRLEIGCRAWNGDYNWSGYISNFRYSVEATYTTGFTPSTTPLAALPTTKLLLNSNRFVDTSSTKSVITVNTGSAQTWSTQAYSPFGGVTSVPTSYSVYFDGTGDYLQMTEPSSTASDVTVECWVFPTVTTARGFVFSAGGNGTGAWAISIAAANTVEVWADSYSSVKFTTSLTVTDNIWNHLALVKTSGVIKIYVNGVLDAGSYTQSGNFGYPTSTTITLGAYNISLNQLFFGYISNFRYVQGTALYSGSTFTVPTIPLTAVSGTQVLTCQSSTLIDNSTNYFAITANGDAKPLSFNPFGQTTTSQVSYTPSVNGGSMYFDGTGDYLSVSTPNITNFGTSNFTMECWFYATRTATYQGVIESRPNATNGLYPTILLNSGNISFWVSGAAAITSTFAINTWYHVAVVRSSGSTKMYLNGVQAGSTYSDTNTYLSRTDLLIASLDSGTNQFQGYISDVRISKGTALYTSNFYPSVAPLTPTTTIGATTYSSHMLVNGTSGGIIDYHSTNNLETVGNTQLISEDPYAGSYYSNYFGGSSDFLSIASSTAVTTAFNFGSSDFTIETWVYTTAIVTQQGFFSKRANTSSYTGIQIGLVNSSSVNKVFIIGSTTGSSWDITYTLSTATIPVSTWTHIALSKNGSNFRVYINGTLDFTVTNAGTLMSESSNAVTIGADAADGSDKFNGYFSNYRIVKGTAVYTSNFTPSTTPLTAISGTSLLTCQSNKFVDNSSSPYSLTVTGSPKAKSFNPFQQNTGKSLLFDGTTDYLIPQNNINFTFGTGDFTIEFWIYYNSFSGGSGAGSLIYDSRPSGTEGAYPVIYQPGAGTTITYYVSSADRISSSSLTTGQWYHVAVSRSGTSTKMFLNGTQAGSTYTDSTTYLCGTTRPIIGASGTSLGASSVNGYIKDLRITKGYARYTTTFTPPTEAVQNK